MPKGIYRKFSEEDKQWLRENYLNYPVKRMAAMLGCGYTAVKNFLKREGLVIPPEIIERNRRQSYFKKGHKSWNTGRKMSEYLTEEQMQRIQRTQFKKGNLPHNTRSDGEISERIDTATGIPYLYIRLSLAKWELLHRVVWEEHHGEIPEGYVLRFKDGDTRNCAIENLECISCEENMLRNSRHNFPEEIIPSMSLVCKIKSQIKQLENG